ncbi:MAG: hypothetical protein ACRD4J_04510 [Nitrososphaeraceae archaeon]
MGDVAARGGDYDVSSNENAECWPLVSTLLLPLADIDMGLEKIKIGDDITISAIISVKPNLKLDEIEGDDDDRIPACIDT